MNKRPSLPSNGHHVRRRPHRQESRTAEVEGESER